VLTEVDEDTNAMAAKAGASSSAGKPARSTTPRWP
jgi:hypothetical protein